MVLRRTALVRLLAGALALGTLALMLLADVASAADTLQNPRRPRAPLWSAETEGWVAGSGVLVKRPDNDKPEPPVSILASPSTDEKYTYGTAYAIGPDGLWLTARHVIDHCRAAMVEGGSILTQLLVIEITAHERADVAVIRTTAMGLDAKPVPLASKSADAAVGYEVGFLQGQPAAFASRYIGTTRARRIGSHPSDNESSVWAISSQLNLGASDLQSLAGAPVLDKSGRALGVVVGESLRRGRLIATLPEAAWEVVQSLRVSTIAAAAAGDANLTLDTYPAVARELVTSRRVARVVCEERRDLATQGHRSGS